MNRNRRHNRIGRAARAAVGTFSVVFAAGCGGLLDVENQSSLLDDYLNNADAIAPLLAGVAGDYAVAYGNGVIITGLLALEFRHVGSFPTWREVNDLGTGRRPGGAANGMYNDFARAVWVADDAIRRLSTVVADPARSPELATAGIWSGFGMLFMADNFCSATFNGGPETQPAEVYALAEARFEEALARATAANNQDLRLRALAGRARARLARGNFTGARDDARQIPLNWQFVARYSENATREYNPVANQMRVATRKEAGVHPRYYGNPAYVAEPRMAFTDFGPAQTGADVTRQFVQPEKYASRGADIPVANWIEARLIEAEAELELGNVSAAIALIDQLRTRAGIALAPYSGPATAEAVRKQLFYEREVELWIQGHLLRDQRRSNSPIMSGRDACFEIGETEWRSNPNLAR